MTEQWFISTGITIKGKARQERGALENKLNDIMNDLCEYGKSKYPDFYFDSRQIAIGMKLSEVFKR